MKEQIRDNSQRSKDITLIFYTFIGINVIAIVLITYQSYILQNYNGDPADVSTIEFLDLILPILNIVLVVNNIISIVFFIRWFKRAYGNLIRRHQPMQYSENGATWGFFIPIMNLFSPVTTVNEIYLKTQYSIKKYNSNLRIDTDTSFIVVWWILFIINRMFSTYVIRKRNNAIDIPSFIDANGYAIISLIITIIAIACALYVIDKITKLETLLRETNESVSGIDEIGKAIE